MSKDLTKIVQSGAFQSAIKPTQSRVSIQRAKECCSSLWLVRASVIVLRNDDFRDYEGTAVSNSLDGIIFRDWSR